MLLGNTSLSQTITRKYQRFMLSTTIRESSILTGRKYESRTGEASCSARARKEAKKSSNAFASNFSSQKVIDQNILTQDDVKGWIEYIDF